jgi:mRNA-degrading endonuclease RelE of RelBE toxin-antitoxin system
VAFRLILRKLAAKEFRRLSDGQQKAVRSVLDAMARDPFPPGTACVDRRHGIWRVKAGAAKAQVRIFYLAPDASGTIAVLAFGTDHFHYADPGALADRR